MSYTFIRVDEFPDAEPLDGTEIVGVVQGGHSRQTTADLIAALAPSGGGGGLTEEEIRDLVGGMFVAGSNVTVTVNDGANTITIAASGGGGGLTEEEVQDVVAAMIVAGDNVTATYNDGAGELTLASTGGGGSGGGGGSDWTQVIDEDGSSLANFTIIAGTWAVAGGVIECQSASGDQYLRLNTPTFSGGDFLFEADLQFADANGYFGGGACWRSGTDITGTFELNLHAGNAVAVTHNVVQGYTCSAAISLNTWTTVKIHFTDAGARLWLNGVDAGFTALGSCNTGNQLYIRSYGGTSKWRNIKVWTPPDPPDGGSGGGGGSGIAEEVTVWVGAGTNLTTTSTSFATIDGTHLPALELTLGIGDVVDLEFICTLGGSSGIPIGFDWSIDQPVSADTNLRGSAWAAYIFEPGNGGTDCNTLRVGGSFVATEAGVHSFLPQWKVAAGTATINLSGSYWAPIVHRIRNFGATGGEGGGGSTAGAVYAASGNPNDDGTVPSPPTDVRALAYDRDSATLDLYKWALADATVYLDNFTGSNGTDVLARTAPNGESYIGNGSWAVQSNHLSGGGDIFYQYVVADWQESDCTVAATFIGAEATAHGLCLRFADTSNYVWCECEGDQLKLITRVAGTNTIMDSWTVDVTGNKVLSVEMAGNEYAVTYNGALLDTVTDAGSHFLTNTQHGVLNYSGLFPYDDLTVTVPVSTYRWTAIGTGLAPASDGGGTAFSAVTVASGNHTIALTGTDDLISMTSASANAFTVPPNSSVAFPVGSRVEGMQSGAGLTTVTPGVGVTIRSRGGALISAGQYARWVVEKIATDEWIAGGDLVP